MKQDIYIQFIAELLDLIKHKKQISSNDFSIFKRKFAKKYSVKCLENRDLIKAYRLLVKRNKIPANQQLENIFRVRKIRTNSGVAVIAVLTKPYKCPGKCAYCPTEKNMPKSYLSNEPAVMRAMGCNFNPYRQVKARLNSLQINGHNIDKIELIVMGGTFSYLPRKYQVWFIKECFVACNESNLSLQKRKATKSLSELQKTNEKAKHRVVGLTLETRPDFIDKKEIKRMRSLGATRVELGVQSIYDEVLEKNNRGHLVQATIQATKLLKNAGFKINYHIMLGLPGSTYRKDTQMMKELFLNPNFQPDMLKLYPCVVLKNTQLYKDYQNKKYHPYNDKKLLQLLCEIKKDIPYYVRIVRVIRDIPSTSIIGGSKISNLRQYIQEDQRKNNWQCKCIRCREIKEAPLKKEDLRLFRIDYDASDGKEIFLSYENQDRTKLYSLLRLRIPTQNEIFITTLKNAALIREVHTYGQMIPLQKNYSDKKSSQHKGLGKKLIQKAEKIASKEFHLHKVAVISGIGVRKYYQKLGYKLAGGYMVKYYSL